MSDLIERQKAIEAIKGEIEINGYSHVVDVLEQLPSAQPEKRTEERTETHACDCISRKASIDADGLDEEIRCGMCKNPMRTDRGCDGNCKYDEILYEKIIQILNKRITPLPSTQPEVLACGEGELIAQPEIVRCKDCKQFRRWIDTDISFCDITEAEMSDNDFCRRAERRTDET